MYGVFEEVDVGIESVLQLLKVVEDKYDAVKLADVFNMDDEQEFGHLASKHFAVKLYPGQTWRDIEKKCGI